MKIVPLKIGDLDNNTVTEGAILPLTNSTTTIDYSVSVSREIAILQVTNCVLVYKHYNTYIWIYRHYVTREYVDCYPPLSTQPQVYCTAHLLI